LMGSKSSDPDAITAKMEGLMAKNAEDSKEEDSPANGAGSGSPEEDDDSDVDVDDI